MEDRRQQHGGDGQGEQAAVGFGGGSAEGLLLALPPADEHRPAGDEQQVAQDRAGEGGEDDWLRPRSQGDEGDDEFGGVAEGGVEQSAPGGAGAVGEVFGGLAHESGEGDDADAGEEEGEARPPGAAPGGGVDDVGGGDGGVGQSGEHREASAPPAGGAEGEVGAFAAGSGGRMGGWRGSPERGVGQGSGVRGPWGCKLKRMPSRRGLSGGSLLPERRPGSSRGSCANLNTVAQKSGASGFASSPLKPRREGIRSVCIPI